MTKGEALARLRDLGKEGSSEAFILRKQAEAVQASRQAVSVPQQWRDTMEELAADLESEIENRRSGELDRRIERDLIVVREARALLAEQEQYHE